MVVRIAQFEPSTLLSQEKRQNNVFYVPTDWSGPSLKIDFDSRSPFNCTARLSKKICQTVNFATKNCKDKHEHRTMSSHIR
jgi:hypothetical protein